MSPHVGNFVQDLVEMAKAVETVPILQAELSQVRSNLDEAQRHNQGLESNIINYKAQIEDLQFKVRSLEVERDDASFRVMEAEDREHAVLKEANVIKDALAMIQFKLDPPKPEPEKLVEELQPQAVPVPTQYEKNTAHATMYGEGKPTEPNPATFTGFEPQGSSETTPTASSVEQSPNATYATTENVLESSSASSIEEASKSDANPPDSSSTASGDGSILGEVPKSPYEGKLYHDTPIYIPLHEWINGGGTEANYHWRPQPLYQSSF